MAANASPIYSRVGSTQGGIILLTAANDYNGQNINNVIAFQSDPTNGSFVQRLRFKAIGSTTSATVARIYLNEGNLNLAATITAVTGTPTGTPSTTGGILLSGTYFAKIQAVDQYGAGTAMSTETASVSVTGPTGSIAWAWAAVTGAAFYRIFVGPVTGGQVIYFTSTTNSFTQTTATINVANNTPSQGNPSDFLTQNLFYGEISLPVVTASATAATPDIDYPMNLALPPGWHIVVGLGTTVTAGWVVTTIGGLY
jgi:hypothetical protein